MNKEQIKQYYERIEKLLNGANKETYGFVPEEIRQILKWYEDLEQQNKKYKEVIDKALNNSQYWIDYYTRLNSDERIALRLQENIDILKEVE